MNGVKAVADYPKIFQPKNIPGFFSQWLNFMNPKHLLSSAHRLMELGEFEQAESCYTELILAGVEHIEIYNNRGSARFALQKYERAIGDYTQAIRINPRIDYPHFNRANCKLALKDIEGAIRDYERALQFNPSHASSFCNRALAYQQKGAHKQALVDFEKALDLAPERTAQIYRQRCESYFALKQDEAAIEDLHQVLKEQPEDKQLIIRLVDIYLERNAFKEALSLCKEGLKYHKEDRTLKLKRAEVYVVAEAPALAWTDLGDWPETEAETNSSYFSLKGQILEALGRTREAITHFEKSLEIDKDHIDAWIFLGGLYLKIKDYGQSLAAARMAQSLQQEYPDSYLLSAKASYEMGKRFAALADLERYENRGGKLAEAFLLKGFVLIEGKRFEEALRAFDKTIKINPKLPDAYLGRGNACLANSQYANALSAYEHALRLAPDFRAALFNKGVALKQLGKPESAFKAWEKAAKLHHPKAELYLRKYRNTP